MSSNSIGSKKQLIMGGIAGLAILGCAAWFVYLATSGGPTVIQPNTEPGTSEWMKALATKQNDIYQQLEKVTIHPSEDGKSIVVSGSVKSAGDLAKLKSTLDAIEPKAPITWDVRVGQ